jgi:NAD(P)-dependent dehydrogenase (short-subunit alcohol dehydrogenase family)
MQQSLQNQVALITGGGRGIGAATAEALARKGAQVIVASRTESELIATVAALHQVGLKAALIVLDVADEAAVAAAFSRITEEWGRLDILVNNAATPAQWAIRRNGDERLGSTASGESAWGGAVRPAGISLDA